jgi:hypothetical protein
MDDGEKREGFIDLSGSGKTGLLLYFDVLQCSYGGLLIRIEEPDVMNPYKS